MPSNLSGIFPALTTPFENGRLSVSQLKSNIEKYNPSGLAGYLVLGSTGESVLIGEGDRMTAIETVRGAARDGMKIIAGTGAPSTRGTIEMTNRAAEAGADFGLVVTPFFYKGQMTAKNLEIYYREVAEHTRIPVLMYSVPKFTGFSIPLDTVTGLADHPNIAGMKDSSGNLVFLEQVLEACSEDFSVMQGIGSALMPSLTLGAKGGILALADMAPVETVRIYRLVKAGNTERARDLQLKILAVNQGIVEGYGVPGIKCALDLLGYYGGEPIPPLQPLDRTARDIVKGILERGGLLPV